MRRLATLSGQIFTPWAAVAGGGVEGVLGCEGDDEEEDEDDSNRLKLLLDELELEERLELEELGGDGGAG